MKRDVGSVDRIFDQIPLSKSIFGLAFFIKYAALILDVYHLYDEKFPIFSQAKEMGAFMAASHIVAKLTDGEVITSQHQLSDDIFFNLTVDDISSTLKVELETKRDDIVTSILKNFLIASNLAGGPEVPEDLELKPSDLDLI